MATVVTRAFARRARRGLIQAYLAVAAITIIVAVFLPETSTWSVLFALVVAALMMGFSAFTLSRAAQSESGGAGWVALDYVVKLAIIGGAVILAKSWDMMNPMIVAVGVVLAVLATTVVQVWAVQPPKDGYESAADPDTGD